MLLYNTLTASKGEFPIPSDRPVTMYVCGVTPYDTTHMGHVRTYLTFDILLRYLRWQGAEVRYCQNVTDVDDPLFERAQRDGLDWRALAEEQTARYVADSAALNLIKPDYFPRASDEIAGMIEITEQLIALGHAYVREGNVYFAIASDPNFGHMARMGYADMLATANERGNTPNDERKRDPLDFVLWQRSKPEEPAWESPWGAGRPGWHIECSAMAMRYLGNQIDIHGGGADLIFPHHACEIAQTEPVTGQRPFVRFWLHAGLVSLQGEKMSKSRGNLVFARDALHEHGPDTLRWYLLDSHYRASFDYNPHEVRRAASELARLREALHARGGNATALDISRARQAFEAALSDDLNTPLAVGILRTAAHEVGAAAAEGRSVEAAQAALTELFHVIGVQINS
jgi:L-cysteine:1D-myo-inositol 2-amino-2-deoxy-alpha-D-glucopyranoside ligase